jgi:4-amino-4-deoxy-L-arabinose transferase-like glycosyltransferase
MTSPVLVGPNTRRPDAEPAAAPFVARHGGALVAVAFFALGLATLADYGITWDEGESYRAGVRNLEILHAALAGRALPPWPWHELAGYQFLADTLRALVAGALDRVFWAPGSTLGFHLVNLALATLGVALVARLAMRESGALVLAPLAATLLVLQPKLVAHAQANPKDVVALAVWSLAMLALARAARRGGLTDAALFGCAAGVALANHVSALLLVPIALVWLLAEGSGPVMRRAAGWLVACAIAAVLALVLWPWLWSAPLDRTLAIARHLRSFDVPMRVLYLGKQYAPRDLPWHYGLVSLAIATPVPILLAAAAGLVTALSRGPIARLCRLAGLWFLALVLADVASPSRYDGARHLLPALPALALLAAGGTVAMIAAMRQRTPSAPRAATVLASIFAASLVVVAIQLAAIHPYEDAFLSVPARAWLGPEAQHRVELEYWGGSYKEGAEWLRAHASRGSLVLVPMGPQAAAPWLGDDLELVPHDGNHDASRPQFLMVMTREAWYTPRVARVVAGERPVFTVRRQGSTLLAIYRVAPI